MFVVEKKDWVNDYVVCEWLRWKRKAESMIVWDVDVCVGKERLSE